MGGDDGLLKVLKLDTGKYEQKGSPYITITGEEKSRAVFRGGVTRGLRPLPLMFNFSPLV